MRCINYIQSQFQDAFFVSFWQRQKALGIVLIGYFYLFTYNFIKFTLFLLPNFDFTRIWNCKNHNPLKVGFDTSYISALLDLSAFVSVFNSAEMFSTFWKTKQAHFFVQRSVRPPQFFVFLFGRRSVAHCTRLLLSSPTHDIIGNTHSTYARCRLRNTVRTLEKILPPLEENS